MLNAVLDSLVSLIYPQNCAVCTALVESRHDGVACSSCWDSTRLFAIEAPGDFLLCAKCGLVFDSPRFASCGQCNDHHYDSAFAVGAYEKALAASIIELKQRPNLPGRLTRLARSRIEGLGIDADLIVPVPLSDRRLLERGFNQAGVIGELVSSIVGASTDPLSLARIAHTPMHRAGLDRRAREMSVDRAFKVVKPRLIAGRSVLLVDDVFTSGSTVSECARELKSAGASKVQVFTLARAVLN